MITFDHVTKRYRTNIGLDDVSVHIKKGHFVFFLNSKIRNLNNFTKAAQPDTACARRGAAAAAALQPEGGRSACGNLALPLAPNPPNAPDARAKIGQTPRPPAPNPPNAPDARAKMYKCT